VDFGDVVLAHQKVHAASSGVSDVAAARHSTPVVQADVTGDAEGGALTRDDGGDLGVAQQCF
jgi:hypothetical protein